jgi:hypothetical protein
VDFRSPEPNFIRDGAFQRGRSLITQVAWVTLCPVASLRFGNVLFIAYPQDHEPRHVHGFTGETEVIVDLGIEGSVAIADRADCIRPGNAKRSDVRKILTVAAQYFDELVSLWERMHA